MLIKFRYLFLLSYFLISSTFANNVANVFKKSVNDGLIDQPLFICMPVRQQIDLNVEVNPEQLFNKNKSNQVNSKIENISTLKAEKLVANEEIKKNLKINRSNDQQINQLDTKNKLNNQIDDKLDEKKSIDLNNENKNLNEQNSTDLNDKPIKIDQLSTNENLNNLESAILKNSNNQTFLELREETSTDPTQLNDKDVQNKTNNVQSSIENQSNNATDKLEKNDNQLRNVFPQKSDSLNGRQTNGLIGSIISSLNPSNVISSLNNKNRPDAPLSLIDNEKDLENSFKQQQQFLEKNNEQPLESINSNSVHSESDKLSESNAQTNLNNNLDTKEAVNSQPSSTTSTTTASPVSSSTLSPEEIRDKKIFQEFFGSRNVEAPSMNSFFHNLMGKFHFSSSKPLPPPAVLKEQIQAEIKNVQLPTVEPIPINQIVFSTPLPILSTADYSNTKGNPLYVSYDDYSKNYEKIQESIKNKYLNDTKEYPATKPDYASGKAIETPSIKPNYPSEAKVDLKDDYTTIDKLKGAVNGPVEIPALKEKLIKPKPIKIPDYIEDDKSSSYRTNNFRLTDLTPFNRMATFSRYGKIASSVGNSISMLYPGREEKQIYPLYGMYRN